MRSKEPYIHAQTAHTETPRSKELCVYKRSKEPYKRSKEPCMRSKETYTHAQAAHEEITKSKEPYIYVHTADTEMPR